MTFTERAGQINREKPQGVQSNPDPVGQDTAGAKSSGSKSPTMGSRGQPLLGLAFATGLLLGWVVIGWWLWPVKWSNSEPWLLRPEFQRTYIALVAENYWHTKDLSRAREAVAGWNEEELMQILSTLQAQAPTPEKRQQVAALTQALALSDPNESLLTSLLSQETLVLSAVLSASPLLAAVLLGVFPLVKGRTKKPQKERELLGQGVEDLEKELDRLLHEEGEIGGEGSEGEEEGEETPQEEIEAKSASEAWEEEIEDEDSEFEGETWVDEEVGEEGQTIEDIFADVFHEEDESFADLEALSQSLPHIDVEELLQKNEQTLDRLIRSNWLRKGAV